MLDLYRNYANGFTKRGILNGNTVFNLKGSSILTIIDCNGFQQYDVKGTTL